MSALLVSHYFSFVLYQINSIVLQTTTNLCGSKLLNRSICVHCIACWVDFLMFIGIDTLLFAVFCQLKSYPDLYAGYVPMGYSDYLKKMSKYFISLIMLCYFWWYGFVVVLVFTDSFFVWMYKEWRMGWSCHIAGCCRLGMRK